jgi:hypothetical protein
MLQPSLPPASGSLERHRDLTVRHTPQDPTGAGRPVKHADRLPGAGRQHLPLYRNSVLDTVEQIYATSCEAADGEANTRTNCSASEDLFGGQLGVRTRFWCEKGCCRS